MRGKVDSLSTKISESIYFWIPCLPSIHRRVPNAPLDGRAGSRPVLHEFGSSGGDFWFCMTVLIVSRAFVAARPDES